MLSPPIITKGYPYPKIVKLASKSANRKLHNSVVANLPTLTTEKARHAACLFCWLGWCKCARARARACAGSHSPPEDLQACLQGAGRANLRQRRIPSKRYEKSGDFEVSQMHFGLFGSVDRFEPAKAFLREEGGTRSVTEGACATLEFN